LPLIVAVFKVFYLIRVAAQQFKIGRKKKTNRALNQKRNIIFSTKSNCGTASEKWKNIGGQSSNRVTISLAFLH
jgi:hypothetical protein